MALSCALPTIPSNWVHKEAKIYKGFAGSGDLIGSHSRQAADFLTTRHAFWNWRLNAVGIDSKTNSQAHAPTVHDRAPNSAATLEIPVTCYQVILSPSLFRSMISLKILEAQL